MDKDRSDTAKEREYKIHGDKELIAKKRESQPYITEGKEVEITRHVGKQRRLVEANKVSTMRLRNIRVGPNLSVSSGHSKTLKEYFRKI